MSSSAVTSSGSKRKFTTRRETSRGRLLSNTSSSSSLSTGGSTSTMGHTTNEKTNGGTKSSSSGSSTSGKRSTHRSSTKSRKFDSSARKPLTRTHVTSSSNIPPLKPTTTTTSMNYDDDEPSKHIDETLPQNITFQTDGKTNTINYSPQRIVGKGSFGIVFLAKVAESGEIVAIKKVLQDRRYKNRELEIMQQVKHPNVVYMKHHFFSHGPKKELYLHLVLEYVPDTIYRFTCSFSKVNKSMPIIYVKIFTYQMLRALNYIHSSEICHRDIKPQNLLIDPVSGILKLCDFGSAKRLQSTESNVAYICSRYYRAPELILGATHYTTSIDIWSAGCVLGEMLLGHPLFPGETSTEQLVEIIKVLGCPTREEVDAMNKNYKNFIFPKVKPYSWDVVFAKRKESVPPEGLELLKKLLQYDPDKRIRCIDALAHEFFDQLREPDARLPNGKPIPHSLFSFSPNELKMLQDQNHKNILVPPHLRRSA